MSREESLQLLRCHLNKDIVIRTLRVCVSVNEGRELLLGFHIKSSSLAKGQICCSDLAL